MIPYWAVVAITLTALFDPTLHIPILEDCKGDGAFDKSTQEKEFHMSRFFHRPMGYTSCDSCNCPELALNYTSVRDCCKRRPDEEEKCMTRWCEAVKECLDECCFNCEIWILCWKAGHRNIGHVGQKSTSGSGKTVLIVSCLILC